MKEYWSPLVKPLDLKNSWPAIVWFFLLIAIMALIFLAPLYFDVYSVNSDKIRTSEYQSYYFLLNLAFTSLIAAIALLQLGGLKKNTRANFLLNIDERWSNKENITARKIIHTMYLKAEKIHGVSCKENLVLITDNIGRQILNLRKSTENDDPNDFILLLSYLDFMETIGYLFKSDYVSINDLNELCGFTLQFNYEIFSLYIKDKKQRHNKNDFYSDFTELYNQIKKPQSENK